MEDTRLLVHVECGNLKADFEGSPGEVSMAFIDFLNRVYPSFKLASKLVFNPDLIKLSRELVGVIEYSQEGLMLLPRDLTSEEAIILSLLGVYVGDRLGLCEGDSISVNEIGLMCGKASKTILNQLKGMIDSGLVERIGRGKYRIRSIGLREAERVLQEVRGRK